LDFIFFHACTAEVESGEIEAAHGIAILTAFAAENYGLAVILANAFAAQRRHAEACAARRIIAVASLAKKCDSLGVIDHDASEDDEALGNDAGEATMVSRGVETGGVGRGAVQAAEDQVAAGHHFLIDPIRSRAAEYS
jgi:hypothetical protein